MVIRPIVCRRFIGRAAELTYLQERRREAGASHGGLVVVSGEAGVGKSRLLAEFAASLANSRWRVATGRCLEFAQRPYAPVLEALARFDPQAAELVSAASKREQFEQIAAAFERTASRGAIAVLIEDLHWADPSTVELLSYLSSKLGNLRMLLVVSLRPETFTADHPSHAGLAALRRAPNAGRIELSALDGPALREFIDEALSGLPLDAEMRRAVAHASEGNPFFAEELLKSAVERGPARRHGAADLPASVRAVFTERLRPLTAAERGVLAQAAVIGRDFDVALLAGTLGSDPATLLQALQRARDLQLITEDASGSFRFRHALTQQAMYEGFLAIQLENLHRTIALHIERLPPNESTLEQLAYHWWAAGEPEPAVRYNEQAGDTAAGVHAHEHAITLYDRAAALAPARSHERGRIMNKIAVLYATLSSHGQAVAAFAAAAQVFATAGDANEEASSLVNAALQKHALAEIQPIAGLEDFLARNAAEHYLARSRVHLGLAQLAAHAFRSADAQRHLDAVDARARREAPDVELRYRLVTAAVSMNAGDADRYHVDFTAWLAAAKATGSARPIVDALHNGALAYIDLGRFDDAVRNLDAARQIGRTRNYPLAEAGALVLRATLDILRGDLRGARDSVDAVRTITSDHRVVLAHAVASGTLAGAYLDDAALIAYWFDEMRAAVAATWKPLYAAGYAEILVRRGRLDEARALLRDAIASPAGARGAVFTLLAAARYADDDVVERARAILVALGDTPTPVLERCAIGLFDAYALRRRGRLAESAAHAAEAIPGLRTMGVRLLEAAAHELAGDRAAAVALYRECGALYDVRRLEPHAPAVESERPGLPSEALSKREREVAALVGSGRSNLDIARELGISQKTVEKHLSSAYQKLAVASRAQLVARLAQA